MRNSDIVYSQIKELIITAEIKPGEVIIENELMDKFGIGRTPIREALNRLSWEGLIRIIPNRLIMVSELPLEDLESIFELRYAMCMLEGRLACEKRTEQEIELLKEFVISIKNQADTKKRIMLDRDFHRTISKMTKNRFLELQLNNNMDLGIRLIFLNLNSIEKLDEHAIKEYDSILQSIIDKDSERLISLLQQHVVTFRNKFIKH